MPDVMTRSATVKGLKKFQRCRRGEKDSWSKTERCPDLEWIGRLIDSAIYHLQFNEVEVWRPKERKKK